MKIYCMYDAPGGIQNKKCFLNNEGIQLQKNDIKLITTLWTFMNPILENEMYKNGFLINNVYISKSGL